MKGIVLAGGTGSRLWPITRGVSKQLLPVFDKPMIYYPLSTLMLAGIRELLVITTSEQRHLFWQLLQDGSQWGISIQYATQDSPRGIADAFVVGANFINEESVALVLGDNIFHGPGFGRQLASAQAVDGATIFAYEVANPSAYGVVKLDSAGVPIALVEKPETFTSNLAIPGLYFYGDDVVQKSRELMPSARGELEITDLNRVYLAEGRLEVRLLPRGTAWLDTGTIDSLHDAGTYVRVLEQRQGVRIGCPEEIAWRNGWISDTELMKLAQETDASGYGHYLRTLAQ